jgi:hypothetical protein
MPKLNWTRWLVALPLAAAMPLAAQTFSAGDDGWTTPSGGQTQVDLSQVPAALTALGSSIVGGDVINLQGSPLDSTNLGTIDTILGRGAISSGGGSLTIVALNLVSSSNVVLADGRQYSLQVCLSDSAQTAGSISLTVANGDGGTFSSSFSVLPKLVFTNVSNHSDVLTVDCGSGSCDTMTMTASNAGWVQTGGPGNFTPSSYGIDQLPNGNDTVANCGGTHTVALVPANGFYPGWTASGGSGGSSVVPRATTFASVGGGGGFKPSPVPHSHASSAAWHHVTPPQDCLKVNNPVNPQQLPNGNAARPDLATRVAYCYAVNSPVPGL